VGFEQLVHRSDAWKYFLGDYALDERFHGRAVVEFESPNEPTDHAQPQEIASLATPAPAANEPNEPTEPPLRPSPVALTIPGRRVRNPCHPI